MHIYFSYVKIQYPIFDPCVLSDSIMEIGERHPLLKVLLLILHQADAEKLEKSLQSKLPRAVGPRTNYYLSTSPTSEYAVSIFSDKAAAGTSAEINASNFLAIRRPDVENIISFVSIFFVGKL